MGTGRRTLTIGPSDPIGGRWLATLTVDEDQLRVFVLSPVASWHDVVDHETTFETDRIQVLPGTLREMREAGVGPPACWG